MYLVLEFAPNGNLKTYLDRVRTGEFKGKNMEKRESISSTELLAYGFQISSGMAFLSAKGVRKYGNQYARSTVINTHG